MTGRLDLRDACARADECSYDPACENYAMNCSAIEAEEREIVERHRPAIEARVRAEVAEEIATAHRLIRDLTDADPCQFDHHGGCQAHGYLSLEPGEKCPHQEAKELLAGAAGSSPDTTPEGCDSVYEGWPCELIPPHPRHTAGDGGMHNGATWTIGNEPRTTPEPPQLKVKLWTSWLPFRFIDYDDAGVTLAAEVEAHREHDVVGAWSAFGWRELRCTTCDTVIWTVAGGVRLEHTPEPQP